LESETDFEQMHIPAKIKLIVVANNDTFIKILQLKRAALT